MNIKIKQIEIMKALAQLLGTTEQELKDFYLLQVNKAKEIVQETFRKQLGL